VAIENVDTCGHFVDLWQLNLWTLVAIEKSIVHKFVAIATKCPQFVAIEFVAIEPGTMELTPLPLTT